MTLREIILAEIQRLAGMHGRPPGVSLFTSATGIKKHEWYGKYWVRWGDALVEAGLERNALTQRADTNLILGKLAEACRHFGHLPTDGELRMYAHTESSFPSHTIWSSHFGSRVDREAALWAWLGSNPKFSDLISLFPNEPRAPVPHRPTASDDGWVYLLQSGPNYKIGRGEDLERRVKQVAVALPDKVIQVHAIRTDDPVGIEAYWHRRFHDKRLNGEWFKLTPKDVLAFKRRKFQ